MDEAKLLPPFQKKCGLTCDLKRWLWHHPHYHRSPFSWSGGLCAGVFHSWLAWAHQPLAPILGPLFAKKLYKLTVSLQVASLGFGKMIGYLLKETHWGTRERGCGLTIFEKKKEYFFFLLLPLFIFFLLFFSFFFSFFLLPLLFFFLIFLLPRWP